MAANEECMLCGSGDFMLSDGLFFCSECGTQSQHVREELTVKDDPSSFVRTIKMTATKKEEKYNHSEVSVTVIEKFQLILQLQCDALIELGCDPSVKDAVRLIWFRYLKHSGYAFENSKEPDVLTSHDKLPERIKKVCLHKVARSQSKQQVLKEKAGKRTQRSSNFTDETNPPTLTPYVTKKARLCDSRPAGSLNDGASTSKGCAKAKQKKKDIKASEEVDVKRKIDFNSETSESEEEILGRLNPLDELPNDSHLFNDTLQDPMDESTSDIKLTDPLPDVDLYHNLLRQEGNEHIRYISLKHTLAICYLGLLYTQQNILLTDYARWIRLHKVPYHNVLGLLPRSYFLGRGIHIFRSHVNFGADRLYRLIRSLCWYLPLPPIPSISASQMCHTLLEKLHLPLYFQKMVDRMLRCIYRPEFDAGFVNNTRTFDIECMVMIMYLLRMIYRLDDIYEFEMVEMVRKENSSEEGDYIYVWEDWMALYCKNKLASLSNAVPINKSELSCVTDHTEFIQFCRDDVLLKARAFPTTADLLRHWNPQSYSGLSDIFKQAAKVGSSSEPASNLAGDTCDTKFKPPRRLYVADLLKSPSVPWKEFDWFQREKKCTKLCNIDLTRSFSFLLKTCSEILDVSEIDLYDRMTRMEWRFRNTSESLKNVMTLMTMLYCVEPHSSTAPSQGTRDLCHSESSCHSESD